jgi:hypothetical protein
MSKGGALALKLIPISDTTQGLLLSWHTICVAASLSDHHWIHVFRLSPNVFPASARVTRTVA